MGTVRVKVEGRGSTTRVFRLNEEKRDGEGEEEEGTTGIKLSKWQVA